MPRARPSTIPIGIRRIAIATAAAAATVEPCGAGVDFNRDVRPILTSTCLRCHGGVRELGGLNLVQRDRALGLTKKGHRAIVPGDCDASELLRRVAASGNERMPPDGEPLSAAQIDTLRRWIADGAPYAPLWSHVPVVAPQVPDVRDASWPRAPLDRFTLHDMERAGATPAAEASRETLIRRASLDLVGLPPTPDEVVAFRDDRAPDAWERVVDRLLASPRFGERWARVWLDLARYADTQGYEKDARRTIWAWRDWLIGALDRDMPYDEFVTRIIAGDLVPNATDDDVAASAFHRNTLTNVEGGTDDEEFRMAAVFDRVAVTWQAFMGTTFQCVQCHSHPYDPFSQREYYEFLAFFNQTEDNDQPDERPVAAMRPPYWRERAIAAADRVRGASFDAAAFDAWIEKATIDPGAAGVADNLKPILAKGASHLDDGERALLVLASKPDDPIAARELAALAPTTVPVMRELAGDKRRATHRLERGSLKKPAEEVEPGTPAVLHAWPEGAPRDRLGLARWLVSCDNPLFGRVAANRIWETLFGRGIVETSEDFGSQGSPPTNQALLDHLASRYAELGWSTKRLLREILLSSTYRQSSVASGASLAVDPDNRWWSRSPRYRLEAEVVRDSALFASGLLSERRFGPSVMPLQPDGVWQVVYSDDRWATSEGEDRYRRSIYTFWRRSSPYPSMVAFDAPSRETCTIRRVRSDTPLAALVTLNDPVWIEASRALARRALAASSDRRSVVEVMFRRALARDPEPAEVERLLALQRSELDRFSADDAATKAILAGEDGGAELAAWTTTASALLSTDEFLSRS
ncbi:MAG: PSD1 and planctomycete cytochrome C domain-containing protein [Phycisphaerales bacterium]